MKFSFDAIGTSWTIEIFSAISPVKADTMQQNILTRVDTYDINYSRFRSDSLVSTMAATTGKYKLPDDARQLINLYRQLYDISGGAVTPLIGRVLESAGYDASYSLKAKEVSAPPSWNEALEYDFPYLLVKQPTLLDFGAAGKGYLLDIVGGLLEEQGINNYYINAGGDILYKNPGSTPLQIALEDPGDLTEAVGIAKLPEGSLCGSSGNRRAWGKYHHIIDPHSLESPRHIAAVWVTAGSGLLADGLTTALFLVSPVELKKHFDFEYAVLSTDYSLKHSPDFPADFFTGSESETL